MSIRLDSRFDGDAWMNNPIARAKFEEGLKELDKQLEPYIQMIRDSERLTEQDYNLTFNYRD